MQLRFSSDANINLRRLSHNLRTKEKMKVSTASGDVSKNLLGIFDFRFMHFAHTPQLAGPRAESCPSNTYSLGTIPILLDTMGNAKSKLSSSSRSKASTKAAKESPERKKKAKVVKEVSTYLIFRPTLMSCPLQCISQ